MAFCSILKPIFVDVELICRHWCLEHWSLSGWSVDLHSIYLYSNLHFWCSLHMKSRWETNINVWFPFMYSQKWNCAASLFPKQNCNFLSPNSYTRISVRDLYISRIGLSILLQPNMWTHPGKIFITHRHMNVKVGTEAVQFPEKEYINGIFLAV